MALQHQLQWEQLVDVVAAAKSDEPLPSEYIPAAFLPNGKPIEKELLEYISGKHPSFCEQAELSFHPQMTFGEACHAKPMPSKFYAKVSRTSSASGSARVSRREKDVHATESLFQKEGPNFYNLYAESLRKGKSRGGTNGSALFAGKAPSDRMSASLEVPAETEEPVRAFGSSSRLASGFVVPMYYASKHRQPDFLPIIFISSAVSAPLQLLNIRDFLEHGRYVDPSQRFIDPTTGTSHRKETVPESIIVSPGSFLDQDKYSVAYRTFRVVDNSRSVSDWKHVCAFIVDGKDWQIGQCFPQFPPLAEKQPGNWHQLRQPSHLFKRVKGFLPYFEEDKIPMATQQWNVTPLLLTRRAIKSHLHILQASMFWEQLYTFLETHPFFKLYTVPES